MQVITSLDADSFGSWEEAGFAPEEAFLEKVTPARIRTLFPLQESSLHRQWKILGNDCSWRPLDHACSLTQVKAIDGISLVETQTFTIMPC